MLKGARILAAAFFLVASCAVITVNVYFPQKEVKAAYKDLEDELMKPDNSTKPGSQPRETPGKEKPSGETPESSIQFNFVGTAFAQDSDLAQRIVDIIKRMPDVVAAYREIGSVIPQLDRLRSSGAVGEANNGMLVPREGYVSPADGQLVDMVNKDRKIVINGMARAIIRINRQPENAENLKQVLPQATEQFAGIRRDRAKKGWWIQDRNGIWMKK